jgi:8-amino-7-oxononanoate synthase
VQAIGESMIVPIIAGTNDAALGLQSDVMAAGFDVRAIRPPSVPAGTARLRVTVRYPVPDSDLVRLAGVVRGSDPTREISRFR